MRSGSGADSKAKSVAQDDTLSEVMLPGSVICFPLVRSESSERSSVEIKDDSADFASRVSL